MLIQNVAVVGLNRLGRSLTTQLADLGFTVTVYDASPNRMAVAVSRGARAALLPADAAENADLVILSVDDEATAEEFLFDHGGIGETLRCGGYVVDASATSTQFRARASERLAKWDITRIDLSRFLPATAAA